MNTKTKLNKSTPAFQLFIGKNKNDFQNPSYYKLVHNGKSEYYSDCPKKIGRILVHLMGHKTTDHYNPTVKDPIEYKNPIKWDFYQDLTCLMETKVKNVVFSWFVYYEALEHPLLFDSIDIGNVIYLIKQIMWRTNTKYREFAWLGITENVKKLNDEKALENKFIQATHWKFPKNYRVWFKALGLIIPQ